MAKLTSLEKLTKHKLIKSMGNIKVVIIGSSNSGKSTFINALCGRFVVPECSHTSTIVTTYLGILPKYVDECAICSYHNKVSPLTYDEFLHKIQYNASGIYDNRKSAFVNKCAFVNINHLLSSERLVLVDTIGTSINDYDTNCSVKIVQKADVVIYMYDASRSANISFDEVSFLKKAIFKEKDKSIIPFERIFFVPNKIDNISSQSSVLRTLKFNLLQFVTLESHEYKLLCRNIIPISALFGRLALVGMSDRSHRNIISDEELQDIVNFEKKIIETEGCNLLERSNINQLINALLYTSRKIKKQKNGSK